jgi:hypothetical protein
MNLQLPKLSICHDLLDERIKPFPSRLHKLWIQVISKQLLAWKFKLYTRNLEHITDINCDKDKLFISLFFTSHIFIMMKCK